MKMLKNTAVICAFYSITLSHAAPNLIDDTYGISAGSFELGQYLKNSGNVYDYMRLAAGQTTISGWTVDGAAGIDWTNKANASNAMDGLKSVDLCGGNYGTGSIRTVVPTVTGRRYLISFGAYGGTGNASGTLTAGNLTQVFTGLGASDPMTAIFSTFQFSFTAAATTTTITFAANDPIGFGPVIDNVVVLSDRDGDEIPDAFESNSGTFVSNVNTGTDPDLADTDGDGINDGAEVQQGRNPNVAEAVLSNLVATQRTGTKFFDISYDLASTTSTVKMSLEISSDGGTTYAVPVTSATGAIGEGITVGSGKSMTWNAGVDWDEKLSSQMRFRLIADNQVIEGLSLIPAGNFTMGRTSGDTDSDALPVSVTVDTFYMGKNEVTKALWDEVLTWAIANGYTDLAEGDGKADNHPVQSVSWWDVVKWCNARSQMQGLTPVYAVSGSVMKTGNTAPTVNWSANGYRLPTEAEWEKAARGGVSDKRFPWGTDTISHSQANYFASPTYSYDSSGAGNFWGHNPTYATGSPPWTSPVGSFAANGFGLNDMAGNVWEWCWDWYGASTYANGANDPRGAVSGVDRVIRGGGWNYVAYQCSASHRASQVPTGLSGDMGFRIARSSVVGALASQVSADTNLDTRMWTLSTSPTLIGTLTGGGTYLSQTSATITATANLGYLFDKWSGDASGTENPLTITMDTDKTVGATFVEDTRDSDSDGLTNYQETITHGTNPDLADTDGDGVNDGQEITNATNPLVSDTDGDGVNDGQEVTDTTNPLVADSDSDGLSDGEEKTLTTNPLLADTDGDSYSDGYEVQFSTDPKLSSSLPKFILTLSNNGTVVGGSFAMTGALAHGTNATITATAKSGYLFSSWTGDASGTANPISILMDADKTVGASFVEDTSDSDTDGLTNYQELVVYLTDPSKADTDGDGVNDGQEVTDTTDALVADSDADGLTDGEEKTLTTNPLLADTDGDSYSDGYEVQFSTDPKLSSSVPKFILTLSNDGTVVGGSFAMSSILAHGTNATITATAQSGYLFGSWTGDASGTTNPTTVLMNSNKTVGATFVEDSSDLDSDGLTNYQELVVYLTDPSKADTDDDGVNDGQEVTDTTDALVADSDADGLTDGEEKTLTTNPLLADTDGDSYSDGYEVQFSTDPKLSSSVPKFILTLSNDGTVVGGSFAMSGNLAHGTNATVTATPQSGYLFSSWTGDASGSSNPTNVLMNSNKTVGASFVEDTSDLDADALTNYQELVVYLTDPSKADTDSDGVNDGQEVADATNPLVADTDADGLSDGEEKVRGTNPGLADTDGDGLSDGDEVFVTLSNPLSPDSDNNGISDSFEDPDNDGIANGIEIRKGSNPKKLDSDNDGLSDTYELIYKGGTDAFTPRIGDRIRLELRELGFQGTYKLVGKLPTGLTFNSLTGVIDGKLTGKPLTSSLTVQVLNGKTVVRSIPLVLPVKAFPVALTGTWQALIYDLQGVPQGLLTTTFTAPGLCSASLELSGPDKARSGRTSFELSPGENKATFNITFPATTTLRALEITLELDGDKAELGGSCSIGELNGFRLARGTELPTLTRAYTMLIDHGTHDGFQVPAGMGWATGSLSNRGSITLTGQLGDAKSVTGTLSLGATGQAILWLKPYLNKSSKIGGVLSFNDTGVIPSTSLTKNDSHLSWHRVADANELSYPGGFAALPAEVLIKAYTVPSSASVLAQSLGLIGQTFPKIEFDGAGLADLDNTFALPSSFVMDSSYKLIAQPIPGRAMAPWIGAINTKLGGFTGTLSVRTPVGDILAGSLSASGVIFPADEEGSVVGAGLVKIPVTGKVGAFRTGIVILNR